jgi:hypothetical protein
VLPALTADGLLPPGIHSATLAEVEELFVNNAPHADHRRVIFSGLDLYMRVLTSKVPSGTMWLDGGFVTHKAQPPSDVDLALLIDGTTLGALTPEDWQVMFQLVTLQGVQSHAPAIKSPRVQPMGGLIDAFMIEASDPAGRNLWEATWSRVMDEHKRVIPGKVKGFVEVVW